jgi:hypothetical protein
MAVVDAASIRINDFAEFFWHSATLNPTTLKSEPAHSIWLVPY